MPDKNPAEEPAEDESPTKRPKVSGSEAEVKVAVPCKCDLGESPVWDAVMKKLHFVDIQGKKLYSWDPATEDLAEWDTPDQIGCVVPHTESSVMIAVVDKIFKVDTTKATAAAAMTEAAALPAADSPPGFRFNDGKCDPSGRLWVGTMNKDWRDPAARKGKLYCMGASMQLEAKVEDVSCSNGMAWFGRSPTAETFDTFFFIDSLKQQVATWDYDDKAGAISNERATVTVPKLTDGGGTPDGMTIDSEGMVWVALANGGCVAQYDPATGQELRRVRLPVAKPTACTFGGPDLAVLYVTTREEGADGPKEAGALFSVTIPGVKGHRAAWPFKG